MRPPVRAIDGRGSHGWEKAGLGARYRGPSSPILRGGRAGRGLGFGRALLLSAQPCVLAEALAVVDRDRAPAGADAADLAQRAQRLDGRLPRGTAPARELLLGQRQRDLDRAVGVLGAEAVGQIE